MNCGQELSNTWHTRLQLGPPEAAVILRGAHIGEHPWREEGWTLLALALCSS